MEKRLTGYIVLGAITVASSLLLPMIPWTQDDISVMTMISADYYNKDSGEQSVYKPFGDHSQYIMNESSRCHQLYFTVKETLCQKEDNETTEDCAFRENGVVKSCSASIFPDEDEDSVVVTCDIMERDERIRVRRSRSGSRGNGGRGGRGGRLTSGRGGRGSSRPGRRSSIASVKNTGSKGNTRVV